MPDGIIIFDPLTGSGTVERTDGSTYEADVNDFTAGRLYISGGFLIDRLDPLNNVSLGRQGPASLIGLEHDRYSLISQTKLGTVNRTVGGDFLRQVEGTIEVTLAGGTIQTYTIKEIPVAGVGAQWLAEAQADGSWNYFTDIGPFQNNADVRDKFGPQYRLATPEEAAFSAIMKRIINDSTGQLQKLIDEYGLETDSISTAEYKAAAIVMKQLDPLSIKSYTSYLVDTPTA